MRNKYSHLKIYPNKYKNYENSQTTTKKKARQVGEKKNNKKEKIK
jgi:hypothetical protein